MKKNISLITLFIFSLFLIISCSSVKKNNSEFNWWNSHIVNDSETHYEIGYAEDPNSSLARKRAIANSNSYLSKYVKDIIEKSINLFDEKYDAGDDSIISNYRNTSLIKTTKILANVNYTYHLENKNNSCYALGFISISELKNSLYQTIDELFTMYNYQNDKLKTSIYNIIDKAFIN